MHRTHTAHLPSSPRLFEPLEPRRLLAAAADDLAFTLYYPEGYAHDGISEFVPITNPNSDDVRFELHARYEVGDRDALLASGVIAAHSRGGVTVNRAGHPEDRLVRPDTPYALILKTSAPVGATMSHYDFGTAIGESFTDRSSTEWTFGEGYKDHNWTRDFVVVYNPGDDDAVITLTAYTGDGQTVSVSQTISGQRRGGWSLDDMDIPSGVFGMKLVASRPIVAALSHYEFVTGRGFGAVGTTDGGATAGVITSAEFHEQHRRQGADDDGIDDPGDDSTGRGPRSGGAGHGGADDGTPDQGPGDFPVDGSDDFFSNPTYQANAYLTVLNTNATPATVTFTFVPHHGQAALSFPPATITIPANSRSGISIRDLGFPTDEEFGVIYRSDLKVTVTAAIYQGDDATGQQAVDTAATQWRFGEGFMNSARAGLDLMEDLYVFNPTAQPVNVTVEIFLSDGRTLSFVNSLGALQIDDVRLHDAQILLGAGPTSFYGIRVSAPQPIVATFEHWDRSLGGGFATAGTPGGTLTPLSSLLPG